MTPQTRNASQTPPAADADTGEQSGAPEQNVPPVEIADSPTINDAPITTQAAFRAAKAVAANDDYRETLERYRAEANGWFGYTQPVVIGALYDFEAHGVQSLTRAQAQAAIEAWLKSPAHTDKTEQEAA